MSDRTQGSVRTEARTGDTSAAQDGAGEREAGSLPPSATQAIPTTGSPRAQTAGQGLATGSSAAFGPGASDGPGAPAPRPATGSIPQAAAAPTAPPQTVPPQAAAPTAPAPDLTETSGPKATTGAPPVPSTGATPGAGRGRTAKSGRGPRRARLQLRHIDTWSAFKISFVLSIALFFIWMVAVGVLYGVLNGMGVFETLNDLFGQLGSASGNETGGDVITPGIVFGGAAVIGAVNIVLLTALCTVATFIYNLCSDLVGGLEVTLSERD